jgi:hypothetical protein
MLDTLPVIRLLYYQEPLFSTRYFSVKPSLIIQHLSKLILVLCQPPLSQESETDHFSKGL